MFDKLKNIFQPKSKIVEASQTSILPFGPSATMSFFQKAGSYENNYPNITRIAERFASVMPYAVDIDTGEKIEKEVPVISALYRPNKQMSCVKFFKALAVMQLVHPVTYILVWHREDGRIVPGGPITAQNIAGFTFLEGVINVTRDRGRTIYETTNGFFTDKEVMALSLDVNPYQLLQGYSPSLAAKRWATVDDYLVDYQAGFFKNGAVPSGQFIVTTATVEEFDNVVDELQKHHRGAGKNNNVMYTHRPVDPVGGKALNPSVEWIPFSQTNKDLSLKEIFDQAERVRDMDFGVPAEIKGYLQNSNYASATTAEHMFDKYVIKPKLIQIWSDFTHELDRITGGLGVAISFDFNPTALADEQKVFNEAKQVQLETYLTALQAGFKAEDAIEALDLPPEFEKLGDLPEQPQTATEEKTIKPENVKSKVVEATENPTAAASANPGVEEAARKAMQEQIDGVIYGADGSVARELVDENLAKEILEALKPGIELNGVQQYSTALAALVASGFPAPESSAYAISPQLLTRYRTYLDKVARSYNDETADAIRRITEQGAVEGWNNVELADNLRGIMDTDEWRVQRLARTETHRAAGLASLDAMGELQNETGVQFQKTWHVNPLTPNHCDYCLEMDGTHQPLGTPFITAEENDFADMEMAAAHPNCACYMTYETVGQPKSVRVSCPKCGRYIAETTVGKICDVKCQGCKRHYDFTIAGGEVSAKQLDCPSAHSKIQDKALATKEKTMKQVRSHDGATSEDNVKEIK